MNCTIDSNECHEDCIYYKDCRYNTEKRYNPKKEVATNELRNSVRSTGEQLSIPK